MLLVRKNEIIEKGKVQLKVTFTEYDSRCKSNRIELIDILYKDVLYSTSTKNGVYKGMYKTFVTN